jgi:uncharacterized protein (TIGR02996 family)
MTDRDALLRSVCAHPDADAPRLIYADWLEENGDPDRAEFIRLQCELAELAGDGTDSQALFAFLAAQDEVALREADWEAIDPGVARRAAIKERVAALLRKNRKAWKAEAPAKCGVTWNGLERGFYASASLLGAAPLARASAALFERVPQLNLDAWDLTAERARTLAAAGVPARVHALTLHGDETAETVRALGESPQAAGIRELTLYGDGDAAAEALAAAPHWHGLRRLDLRDAGLSGAAAAALFSAKHLRGLRELRVGGGSWKAGPVRALVKNHFTELHTLELFFGNLGDEEAAAIAGCAALKNLRTLELPSSRITGKGATLLLTSKRLKHLAVLNLYQNRVRKLDAKALARAGHASLRALKLESNDLTADDLGALAAAPALRNLLWLSLEKNDLGDRALARLVEAAGPKHLAVLNLLDNAAGDAGVTALANWPGLKHVRCLHLNGNAFGPAGAGALAASPFLEDLAHLCFDKAKVGAAVRDLQKRFGKAARPH